MRFPSVALDARWLRAGDARVEGQLLQVTAGAGGRVERVLVSPNQLVKKDQTLVTLDARDLDREVERAAARLAHAAAASAAGRGTLSRLELGPSPEIANARMRYALARVARSNAGIRAPSSGRVVATAVRPGDVVSARQPLVSILESSELWVMATFAPRDFAALRLGQHARVVVGLRHFDATVSGFVTADDPVLIEFEGRPHPALRPGMHVKVSVRDGAEWAFSPLRARANAQGA